MKRSCILLLFLIFGILFTGCTPHTDHLAPLRGDFTAEVAGEMNGVSFSALCTALTDGNGERTVTLTFYAPTALCDTVIKRAHDGAITLSVGEVAVSGVPDGITPLFALFAPDGEVTAVSLTDEGHTKVTGEGFAVTFLSDGTPYLLENSAARVTVVRFEGA